MTESESTIQAHARHPLIIVLTEPDAAIDAHWLAALRRQFAGDIIAGGAGAAPADVEFAPGSREAWWRWLADLDPERTAGGVLVLGANLALPERFAERLDHLLASPECPPLSTLPGNHQAGLDPAAGLVHGPFTTIDSVIQAAARLRCSPVRYRPERVAIIRPGCAGKAIRLAERGHCWIYDGLWVGDGQAAGHRGPSEPDQWAALGHLRAAVARLVQQDHIEPLPLFGFDQRPVVLHISHDWGGGVARWIGDIVAADRQHNHLVLSAAGRTDGKTHGQWLKLYAAGPGRACIEQWTLAPAIVATDIEHAQYRQLLAGVIERFGVARIIVSSLIGHSLEALATGLPTITMLHDYYPAWPVLDSDPAIFIGDDGRIDLDQAISKAGHQFLFAERRAEFWRRLADAWLASIRSHQVALAAPAAHVLKRWRQLVGDPLAQAQVVPHGFAGWPAEAPEVKPRALSDGRLNLVIVGRLSPGKGLGLLEQALDQGLGRHARITLLGCGRHGMRLFGRRDVDIVLDYRRAELPGHLARIGAQAALFLSTVPETWNYVLSETRALGLVPVAARTGSFVARIDDGVDGILFDPDPAALVRAVEALHQQPGQLDQLRTALPGETSVARSVARLDDMAGLVPAPPAAARRAEHAELQSASESGRLAEALRRQLTLEARIESLRTDLAERTDWARKHERLAAERTRWARRQERLIAERAEWARKLERLVDERTRWARQLEHDVAERTRWAQRLDEEIGTLRQQLTEAGNEIARQQRELEQARAHAVQVQQELSAMVASRSWKLTRPLRVASRLGSNARIHRLWLPARWPQLIGDLVANIRTLGWRGAFDRMQALPARPARPAAAPEPVVAAHREFRLDPVETTAPEKPVASIIVPVYNKVEYTANCLNSIVEHTSSGLAEIIVVDDASSDGTADYLARCRGIRVVRNRRNSGFIRSCNRGAQAARGEFLVFLNNDTSVTDGWLTSLLAPFAADPKVGIVGARLVYPDGRLQEAGGIIFQDGSGWNYGRDDDATLPQYNFLSEADYVSGACLAIRREDFRALGGFDTRYAPAYYEDTDLCFAARARGQKVIYQPGATVIHHEGVSSGTDEASGTKKYQAINRNKFVEKWRDVLITHPPARPDHSRSDPVRHHRFRRYRQRLLLIDAVTPQPDHDSGSVRIKAIMELFIELGCQVTFMPENLAWVDHYSRALQQLGIEVLHAPAIAGLDDWLAEHGGDLDLVFVSRHYVLAPIIKTLRQRCPSARLVFDTVDLHFLREQRAAELSGSDVMAEQARRSRRQELKLMRQADITLVVSDAERVLLEKLLPEARVQVLSNVHSVQGCRKDFDERSDLLFVGGFQHVPNIDAARWLVDEIFPLVREQLPEVVLHLIGSRMPPEIASLDAPGVRVHGFVADLDPYLDGCRLSLAPLRYGAGVKGKVNQAMSHGLPVIATSCAAEGMFLQHGRDVLIADDAAGFAKQIVRAYRDQELWQRLSAGGIANVEAHFSVAAARAALKRILQPQA